jgi:uncharacterized membrane protein (UPF0182 family)
VAVLCVLAALVGGALLTSNLLINFWWFSELGQEGVYRGMVLTELTLGGGTTVFVMLVLGGNAWLAVRLSSKTGVRIVALAGVSLVTGAVLGWRARVHWQLLELWLHRQNFGVDDPLHHRDVGFFVFTLPLLEWLVEQLVIVALLTILLTVIVYGRTGALQFRPLYATPAALTHVSVLAALLLLTLAAKVYLTTFTIEFRQPLPREVPPFAGAHFTDVRATLLGLQILIVLLIAGAIALVACRFVRHRYPRHSRRVVFSIPLVLIASTLLSQIWIPAVVQHFDVRPDPYSAERPFLADSIAATRSAFGLGRIEVHRTRGGTGHRIALRRATLAKLRRVQLWDTPVVAGQMRQLSSTTPYFRPADPSFELAPGVRKRTLLVAEREVDLMAVPRSGNGWINDRLAYTHGFGAFQFSTSEIRRQGGPAQVVGARLRQPRIYFGREPRGAPSWVVANSRRPEVDPGGASYHYHGRGGVQLSNWLTRAAFALQLRDPALLVSDEITPASRLILHRDVVDRLRTLAPFLAWDAHPAPVIAAGHIVFMDAGYTTSDYYPYAQRARLGRRTTSYARAAVTASVDAYSGKVRIYTTNTTDPILRAWRSAFPSLFTPCRAMPAALRNQLRYPPELFDTQATLYAEFHTTQPATFASKAATWAAPISLSGPISNAGDIRFDDGNAGRPQYQLKPSYRFAAPPGHHRPHILRSMLYSPYGAQNLKATLDGWSSRDGRLHLVSRRITGGRLTPGPAQVSRLVFLTPHIARALNVENREVRDLGKSSLDSLALGSPHVVFFPDGQVQVQAVYTISSGGGIVRRRAVTVYANRHAAIAHTLNAAARRALSPPVGKHHR